MTCLELRIGSAGAYRLVSPHCCAMTISAYPRTPWRCRLHPARIYPLYQRGAQLHKLRVTLASDPSAMTSTPLIFIEGDGPETLVLLHGWPDTPQVWNAQIAAFKPSYRCLRFALPGFVTPAPAPTLESILESLAAAVDTASPDAPVTLVLHDWGCVFGYEYAQRYPERVRRVVAVDIGDAGSKHHLRTLPAQAKLGLLAYQWALAASWVAPRALATPFTRWLARALGAKSDIAAIHGGMNYPYAMRWLGVAGGLKALKPVRLTCPMFFAYGERKPFMFHSREWTESLAARPGCKVQSFATGHWVMKDAAESFNAAVLDWLRTPAAANGVDVTQL